MIKILKRSSRRNEIHIKENYAELHIYSATLGEITVLIDIEDIDKIQKYSWHAKYHPDIKNHYIRGGAWVKGKKTTIALHRYILDILEDSITVDHINKDTCDNRKVNLRICSQKENNLNQGELRQNNRSGHRNISWQKQHECWIITLHINNRNKTIGRTRSLEEAISIRDEAKKEYGVRSVYNT